MGEERRFEGGYSKSAGLDGDLAALADRQNVTIGAFGRGQDSRWGGLSAGTRCGTNHGRCAGVGEEVSRTFGSSSGDIGISMAWTFRRTKTRKQSKDQHHGERKEQAE